MKMHKYDKILILVEHDWFNPALHPVNPDLLRKIPVHHIAPYFESYDSIIPLIQKQPREVLVRLVLSLKGQNDESRMVDWLLYTPEQLCDHLIRGLGRWVE